MTLKTKYGIDDTVWLLHHDRVISAKVKSITFNVARGNQAVYYQVENEKEIIEGGPDYSYNHVQKGEYLLFPTKEKLIKSL